MLSFLFIILVYLIFSLESSNAVNNQTQFQSKQVFSMNNITTNQVGNVSDDYLFFREMVNKSAISNNMTFDDLLLKYMYDKVDGPVNMSYKVDGPVNMSYKVDGPVNISSIQSRISSDIFGGTVVPPDRYIVKVTFDSITVLDDHDHDWYLESPFGTTSGGGEFHLWAYVQGKKIDLTRTFPHGWGLWSIDSGDTRQFPPGTDVTVTYRPNELKPLSIMTMGYELDKTICTTGDWSWRYTDPEEYIHTLPSIFNLPNHILPWKPAIENIQKSYESAFETFGGNCGEDRNNILGRINNIYMPPGQSYEPIGWGAGSHNHVSSNKGDYILRYTISVTHPIVEPVFDPGSEACTTNKPTVGVASSGSILTFVPSNVIDNNFNTKWWSTFSLNPFITLDLGSPKPICSVDIAWADGDEHPYNFVISVSNDGTNFMNVLSGTSMGTTTQPEKYVFPEVQAKNVKITITQSHPGNINSVAEISEIDVFGKS